MAAQLYAFPWPAPRIHLTRPNFRLIGHSITTLAIRWPVSQSVSHLVSESRVK